MTAYKQVDSDIELQKILELQQQNLPKNLTEKELLKDGFLTVEHDFELLKKMNATQPHTIAKNGTAVIGYALSMHPKFAEEIEVLKPMFREIQKVVSKDATIMIMGQICIAKAYRGQGIFRGLYQSMQKFIPPRYSKIITEVDVKNIRSMNAHKAIGFKELKRYFSDGKGWSLIMLD